MTDQNRRYSPFPTSAEDRRTHEERQARNPTPQTESDSYRLAFADVDFLTMRDLRPVRLQLEMLKPELLLQDEGVVSTVVVFGSARIPEEDVARQRLKEAEGHAAANPDDAAARRAVTIAGRIVANSRYYAVARDFARKVSEHSQVPGHRRYVVCTGGGPGIMEAANRGAADVNADSIGLSIVLPHEQAPNGYITPKLSFNFHYFAVRKMHFLIRAEALACFPGGFGTMDELFEALTLIQTGKIQRIPVLLFGKEWWQKVINFEALVEEGTISPEDLEIFHFVETAEEGWKIITDFYNTHPHPNRWADPGMGP